MVQIHPLAVVGASAKIGRDVRIGPFSIVEGGAEIGDRCVLESHVVIKRATTLGTDNHVHEGAVLGGLPQHVHRPEQSGSLVIGSGNTIREYVTIHRALEHDQATVVGDNNMLMASLHIGHDCRIGSSTIMANNGMLAGHVTVEDRAYLSGSVAIHQFCRIGSLAMLGGMARIGKDVPPYVTVDGGTGLAVGLNSIGLRRAGMSAADVRQLKAAYRVIYRSGLKWQEIIERLRIQFTSGPAARYQTYLAEAKRGIIGERREPPAVTLKLTESADEQPLRKAG